MKPSSKKFAQQSEKIKTIKIYIREIGFFGEWNHIVGAEDDKVIAVDSEHGSDT